MSYAKVVDGEIVETRGVLPETERRLDTGEWVMSLALADEELVEATGWFEVVETERPDVGDGEIADQTIELVDGVPTRVWTVRAKNEGELDYDAELVGRDSVKAKMQTALNTNTTFLDLATVTTAQAAAQVKALTRQVNGIIRLIHGDASLLRDTSDT